MTESEMNEINEYEQHERKESKLDKKYQKIVDETQYETMSEGPIKRQLREKLADELTLDDFDHDAMDFKQQSALYKVYQFPVFFEDVER